MVATTSGAPATPAPASYDTDPAVSAENRRDELRIAADRPAAPTPAGGARSRLEHIQDRHGSCRWHQCVHHIWNIDVLARGRFATCGICAAGHRTNHRTTRVSANYDAGCSASAVDSGAHSRRAS